MTFAWLKRYTPRGLYGRAALIMLVPIITILLFATLIFIQRHYQDVARQMTSALSLELNMILDRLDEAADQESGVAAARPLAGPLKIVVFYDEPPAPTRDLRRWYDFSGPAVFKEVRARVEDVQMVDMFTDWPQVRIWVQTIHGTVRFSVPARRITAANPHQFLAIILLVAVVMTVVSFIFLRNQLRPIRRLARAAEAFGRGQNVPYSPAGAIETRAAGAAFLEMRDRIERQIEQRTLMLSGVSHDLRTPLTRMRLGLSMMEEGPETEGLASDINEMERLLDEFLDFARADALDDPTPTDVSAFLRECVAKLPGHTGRVTIVLPDDAVTHAIRPMAMGRAVTNLVGNSLRYATNARVGLDDRGTVLVIWVEDDGPGIPEDARQDALKPFVRLDTARNQNRGTGVGLGLSIAADIARRHGGSLSLGSSQEMGGLRVEIALPR